MSKTLKKRNALGRGLGALLSDSENIENTEHQPQIAPGSIAELPVAKIEANRYQPRTEFEKEALDELANSIRTQGIIQPLTVRKIDGKDNYELISGERRLRASKQIGLENVPCYIRTANDHEMLEMALIENTHRKDLNAIEIAISYERLVRELQVHQEDVAKRVGKDRTTVNNYLRLLRLPDKVQAGLRDQKIAMGHARALITMDKIEWQLDIYDQIIEKGLSVRKVEELVRNIQQGKEKIQKPKAEKEYVLMELEKKLTSQLSTGSKVIVKRTEGEKGEIKIPFMNDEDLNRILEVLQK